MIGAFLMSNANRDLREVYRPRDDTNWDWVQVKVRDKDRKRLRELRDPPIPSVPWHERRGAVLARHWCMNVITVVGTVGAVCVVIAAIVGVYLLAHKTGHGVHHPHRLPSTRPKPVPVAFLQWVNGILFHVWTVLGVLMLFMAIAVRKTSYLFTTGVLLAGMYFLLLHPYALMNIAKILIG